VCKNKYYFLILKEVKIFSGRTFIKIKLKFNTEKIKEFSLNIFLRKQKIMFECTS
jgi:hypothetical protein